MTASSLNLRSTWNKNAYRIASSVSLARRGGCTCIITSIIHPSVADRMICGPGGLCPCQGRRAGEFRENGASVW